MSETYKLKDGLGAPLLERMAARLGAHTRDFDQERFVRTALAGLEPLELTGRVRHIASALHATLPGSVEDHLRLLIAAMGPALPHTEDGTKGSDGFLLWPFGEYIARYGGLETWEASWLAMEELTQRSSSEFAVRPFLALDLGGSLDRLQNLLTHPSHHVRRWASEGTRTRLPWAKAVPGLLAETERRLSFLEALKDDPSLYVRRSVANHLQDILKDDLAVGFPYLERWARSADEQVRWVAKHAARGLLKSGRSEVLSLFGWSGSIVSESFAVAPARVTLGQAVALEARLTNPNLVETRVRVDFELQGPTPSGRTFQKVFRWTELSLQPSASVTLSKAFPFVVRSTRKLPPGDYRFNLLVNGSALDGSTVTLVV